MIANWIEAGDSLPEDGASVLVTHRVKGGRWLPILIAKYEDGGWFTDCHQLCPPSHWMPMPEQPKDATSDSTTST